MANEGYKERIITRHNEKVYAIEDAKELLRCM